MNSFKRLGIRLISSGRVTIDCIGSHHLNTMMSKAADSP
jgi:hypothetical protein